MDQKLGHKPPTRQRRNSSFIFVWKDYKFLRTIDGMLERARKKERKEMESWTEQKNERKKGKLHRNAILAWLGNLIKPQQ